MTLQSDPARVTPEIALVDDGLTVVADDMIATESAEPQRRPALRELPLAAVLTCAGAGLIVVALHHFRWGNLLVGGSLALAALMRLVLPTRQAGLLAVRSRFTDVLTMSLLGGSLMLLTVVTRT